MDPDSKTAKMVQTITSAIPMTTKMEKNQKFLFDKFKSNEDMFDEDDSMVGSDNSSLRPTSPVKSKVIVFNNREIMNSLVIIKEEEKEHISKKKNYF